MLLVEGDMKIYSGFEFRKKIMIQYNKIKSTQTHPHMRTHTLKKNKQNFSRFQETDKEPMFFFLLSALAAIGEFAKNASRIHISSTPVKVTHKK